MKKMQKGLLGSLMILGALAVFVLSTDAGPFRGRRASGGCSSGSCSSSASGGYSMQMMPMQDSAILNTSQNAGQEIIDATQPVTQQVEQYGIFANSEDVSAPYVKPAEVLPPGDEEDVSAPLTANVNYLSDEQAVTGKQPEPIPPPKPAAPAQAPGVVRTSSSTTVLVPGPTVRTYYSVPVETVTTTYTYVAAPPPIRARAGFRFRGPNVSVRVGGW